MIALRLRSLQLQLTLRLGLLFLAATALAVGALLYQTYRTAESLSEENLIERAQILARFVFERPDGDYDLDLPAEIAAFYAAPAESSLFAIRDRHGEVIAASSPAFAAHVKARPSSEDEPRFFRLESFGPESSDYYGLDLAVESVAGPLSVSVAQSGETDALLHAMLREFVFDVAWIIPVFVAATLLVAVLTIRAGLKPLRQASEQAAKVAPGATSVRLSVGGLPSEIIPLVEAVNHAFDRLEQGFTIQRRFTADAAHELRTPLTIITGALDALEGNGELSKLRDDVARMNRLVEQLLRVARLDSIALDVSTDIDLAAVASEAVEYLAPLAISQERSIALNGADRRVSIKGNRHAVEDALRNLIENAIAHTPPNTEILVEVMEDGKVSVADHGTGVRAEDREHLFDRFWRARGAPGAGAGLGLAIVKETMKAHGGRVVVDDAPGGGARFTLRFQG
ncbi:MAG: ATP-binding protein [Hyphomonas sp.]|jgi:signal transduction histidine kinase|tara:strand:- start:2328 stop:3692 length:1365 start_codon:yes stop_codon:yes gene_type:complete